MKIRHKIAIALVLLAATGIYISIAIDKTKIYDLPEPKLIGAEKEHEAVPQVIETSITLAAVGDIIVHTPMIDTSEKHDGAFDFTSCSAISSLI